AKESKVHPTFESKTTFGRLVPWTDRSRRSDRKRDEPTKGGIQPAIFTHRHHRCRAADPPSRERLPVFPMCHAEYRRRAVGFLTHSPPAWRKRRKPVFRRMPTA